MWVCSSMIRFSCTCRALWHQQSNLTSPYRWSHRPWTIFIGIRPIRLVISWDCKARRASLISIQGKLSLVSRLPSRIRLGRVFLEETMWYSRDRTILSASLLLTFKNYLNWSIYFILIEKSQFCHIMNLCIKFDKSIGYLKTELMKIWKKVSNIIQIKLSFSHAIEFFKGLQNSNLLIKLLFDVQALLRLHFSLIHLFEDFFDFLDTFIALFVRKEVFQVFLFSLIWFAPDVK